MTPTATVCLMSRTAKRPSGGKSEKASTHMGFDGTRLTMAASPDLIDLGLSSTDLPERRGEKQLGSQLETAMETRPRSLKQESNTFIQSQGDKI
jgi:hypothetical protein